MSAVTFLITAKRSGDAPRNSPNGMPLLADEGLRLGEVWVNERG
jgi:hypothetical protein